MGDTGLHEECLQKKQETEKMPDAFVDNGKRFTELLREYEDELVTQV